MLGDCCHDYFKRSLSAGRPRLLATPQQGRETDSDAQACSEASKVSIGAAVSVWLETIVRVALSSCFYALPLSLGDFFIGPVEERPGDKTPKRGQNIGFPKELRIF